MTVCEFLHCTFSELPNRVSIIDEVLILAYLKRKAELQEEYLRTQSSMTGGKPSRHSPTPYVKTPRKVRP